jgi:hypothetical protein
MTLRRLIAVFSIMIPLALAVTAIASASTASASTASAATPFSLSVDNNIVVPKDAPNLQFTILETNTSGATATCQVYIQEMNFWTPAVEITSGATTGVGAPFPTTKKSALHYQMWCGGVLVATAKSKLVMTDHVG